MNKFATSKFAFWLTYVFSRVLNFIVNLTGKYNSSPKASAHIFDARERLRNLTYKEDRIFGVKSNWMRPPEYVEYKLKKGLLPDTDCDEFAMFACRILEGTYNTFNPRVLTIRWVSKGKVEGHNTCVFEYKDVNGLTKLGTLCNWGLNKGFYNLDEVSKFFASAKFGKVKAYCEVSDTLRLIKYVKVA
jgi:hypothetical protein